MISTTNSIKDDIFNFLKSSGIMTLAVSNNDEPWVCTLYYGIDNDMNMYVVTDPNSVHGKMLDNNRRVAFNIFDSHQKITKPKKGVQGTGLCVRVKGLKDNSKGLLLWHKANPGIEEKITIKDILKKLTDTKVYKITPKYMKFFNKELYVEKEYGELNLS